jgi:PAS domain-containing protein
MRWHRDISISHKLQGIVVISCGVALSVASVAFTVYDRTTFLQAKTTDLIATAKMIGSNSTAALTFHDSKSAREILSALQAKQHVINACIYDSTGKVFAKYTQNPTQSGSCPPAQSAAARTTAQHMTLFQDIALNSDPVGTIYMEADLGDLHERLLRFVAIDFIVLLGSLAVASLLSYRLQRVISEPIRELAETASSVSAHENYSIRAAKKSQDEIGVLFDQFNGMLDRIEQRDVAIQKAHDGLERRVEERTSYLNALIENSPLAIMVLDSAEKVDGLLADGDLLSESRNVYRKTLDGTPVNLVTRRKRKDGSLIDVELHSVPLIVKGEMVGSLALYQDISVRKRTEEAMRQARSQPKPPAGPRASSSPI